MKKSRIVGFVVPAAITLALLLLAEGGASLLMAVRAGKHAMRLQEEAHVRYDPVLGWSHVPGLRIENVYEPGTVFTTNSQGFRARQDFSPKVPAGRYRVVALGDSFTMGFGVGDGDPYAAQLESSCPTLQTVNMGQGGYGLDQIYLWYKRDGVRLEANVLLLAIIGQDFYRMSSDSFIGYSKPVLSVKDGALVAREAPPSSWAVGGAMRRARAFADALSVSQLARVILKKRDQGMFYGETKPEIFATAALAIDDLAKLSRERGQAFVLIYLPSSDVLPSEPTKEALWMEDYARSRGLPFVNMAAEFERLSPARLKRMYRPDYHYTVEGNRFVAHTLMRLLPGLVPSFPACPVDADLRPSPTARSR